MLGVDDMRAFIRAAVVLILILAAAGGIVAYSIARRGLSARTDPSAAEAYVARTMRRLATPSAVRSMKNPVQPTDAVLTEGLEHFADHCALCHANNGSGDTDIGRGLYPRAPDMRASQTQALTDGELLSIIENGVRLTGMPAWGDGTPESERAGWVLVHFIRRLPKLTDEEIRRMERLNPKTGEQWQNEAEAERRGEDAKPATPPPPHQHKHGKSEK